jgi:hypothetical protein
MVPPLVSLGGQLPTREATRALKDREGLPDFLEKGKAGADVLRHFVPSGKRIQRAFFCFAGEEVKGHFLTPLELLAAAVEEIGFTGFFALNAV